MNLFSSIKCKLLPVLSRILIMKDRLRWLLSLPFTPKPILIGKRTISCDGISLIIAPHADDELIGCFSFIKKHPNSIVLYCGLLGSHNNEENAIIRRREFISFCEANAIRYKLLGRNLKKEIISEILILRPSNILIPSFVDWHNEHRLINTIVLDLVDYFQSCNIIWYRISVPIMLYNYSVEESKHDYISKWKNFLLYYQSQKSINYRRFQFVEKHCKTRVFASELYYIQSTEEFKGNMSVLLPNTLLLDSLKTVLDDNRQLSRNAQNIYKLLY